MDAGFLLSSLPVRPLEPFSYSPGYVALSCIKHKLSRHPKIKKQIRDYNSKQWKQDCYTKQD